MAQTWDAEAYGENGAFVHGLAGGVLEWLAAQPGERILDLGCGDGQLTQRIAASGASVAGLDTSPQMAAAARARGIRCGRRQRRVDALCGSQPSTQSFPTPRCTGCADQDAMMAEVRRVLKPGGRFVAEMGGHGNIAAIRVALMAVLARHGFDGREDNVNYYPTPEAYTRRLSSTASRLEQIALIPRPTRLAEGGMRGWIRRFAAACSNAAGGDARNCCGGNSRAAGAGTARRGWKLDRRLRAPAVHCQCVTDERLNPSPSESERARARSPFLQRTMV